MSEIDTFNKFLVGKQGDAVVFLRPLQQRLTEREALLLAAYLIALCDYGINAPDPALDYAKVQEAVNNA